GPALLALIPGLRAHTIDVSCSGMAGTLRLQREKYARSLHAGRSMLGKFSRAGLAVRAFPRRTFPPPIDSCRGKRTLHPAQYLALAYGLMPELWQRLKQPIGDLVLR